jgi:hypothetical protein
MMMRTTVTLDDEVASRLKQEMQRTGKSFKQALNDAVREGLARRKVAGRVPPYVVRPRPMGTIPGLDYANVAELLEVAEGPAHR